MHSPDYVEAITGWRAWRAPFDEPWGATPQTSLAAMSFPVGWISRHPQLAHCRQMSNVLSHASPHISCECGIYAHKTLHEVIETFADFLLRDSSYIRDLTGLGGRIVIGRVMLWGRIIEHHGGYRAECAYPLSLMCADERHTSRLANEYRCEEEKTCTWDTLLEKSRLSLYSTRSRSLLQNMVYPHSVQVSQQVSMQQMQQWPPPLQGLAPQTPLPQPKASSSPFRWFKKIGKQLPL